MNGASLIRAEHHPDPTQPEEAALPSLALVLVGLLPVLLLSRTMRRTA